MRERKKIDPGTRLVVYLSTPKQWKVKLTSMKLELKMQGTETITAKHSTPARTTRYSVNWDRQIFTGAAKSAETALIRRGR